MLSLLYLTQEKNTVSVEHRTAIASIRVSARIMKNPVALFWWLATALVKDYFEGGALFGV